MLTVNSAKFYENFQTKDNQVSFSEEYTSLTSPNYPTDPKTIILAIDFHANEDINGHWFIRVALDEQVIYETALSHIELEDVGNGKDVGFMGNINDIVFPKTGIYNFDIIFKDSIVHSIPLALQ